MNRINVILCYPEAMSKNKSALKNETAISKKQNGVCREDDDSCYYKATERG
jgi:hypothetical protein